ncbi:MAG: hypothetical protein PHO00_05785 [bacterium]|nr:hypothetical protein [bacterium]
MRKRVLSLLFSVCSAVFLCVSSSQAVYILSSSKYFGVFAEDTALGNELAFQAEKMFMEMDKLFRKNPEINSPILIKYSELEKNSEFEMVFKGYRITFFSDGNSENNYKALAELCSTAYFMIQSGLEDAEIRIGSNPVPYWVYAGAAGNMMYKQRYGVWKFVMEEYAEGKIDFGVLFADAGKDAKIDPAAAGLLFSYINSNKKKRDLFLEFVSSVVGGTGVEASYKNTLFRMFGSSDSLIADFLLVADDKVKSSLFELMYDEDETREKLVCIVYTDPGVLGFESDGKLTLKQLYPFMEHNEIRKLIMNKSVEIKDLAVKSHLGYKDLIVTFDCAIEAMMKGDKENFNRYFHSADKKARKLMGSDYKAKKAKIKFSDARAAMQTGD